MIPIEEWKAQRTKKATLPKRQTFNVMGTEFVPTKFQSGGVTAVPAQADVNKNKGLINAANQNLESIQEINKGMKYFGPLGDVPSLVAPSTVFSFGKEYGPRMNWESNINRLLSSKVLDIISAMKNQSRTGATGFGQLNRSELKLLKDASTVLNKKLAPKDAKRYIDQLQGVYQKVVTSAGGKLTTLPKNNFQVGGMLNGSKILSVEEVSE